MTLRLGSNHLLRIVMEPNSFAFSGHPNHTLTFGDWIPRLMYTFAFTPLNCPVVQVNTCKYTSSIAKGLQMFASCMEILDYFFKWLVSILNPSLPKFTLLGGVWDTKHLLKIYLED